MKVTKMKKKSVVSVVCHVVKPECRAILVVRKSGNVE